MRMKINQNCFYVVNGADLREFGLQLLAEKREEEKDAELVPVSEVCRLYKVSKPTLWRWGKKGIVNPTKRGGKVYFQKSELNMLKKKEV